MNKRQIREARQLLDEKSNLVGFDDHDFDWDKLGIKMKMAYEWLLGQGEKPEWVRVG